MLPYYISGSNNWCIRTENLVTASANTLTMSLHLNNMYTLATTSQSVIGYTYNDYESMLQFTGSIASASVGSEYRATLYSGSCSVWNGTIQVYGSQSIVNKAQYENQNQQYISNTTDNEYIIMK
jgi:hypothetical protein